MSQRITREDAREFKQIFNEIMERTQIPQSWLAELLGYSKSAGLVMALQGSTNPSRAAYDRIKKLQLGLNICHNKRNAARAANGK